MHQISGRIIRPFLISDIRPDTRLPCPISDRISGIRLLDNPDIRLAGYPAKTVSGASLLTSNYLGLIFHRLPVSFFIDYEFDGLWY
jgi:hypothetical protein